MIAVCAAGIAVLVLALFAARGIGGGTRSASRGERPRQGGPGVLVAAAGRFA